MRAQVPRLQLRSFWRRPLAELGHVLCVSRRMAPGLAHRWYIHCSLETSVALTLPCMDGTLMLEELHRLALAFQRRAARRGAQLHHPHGRLAVRCSRYTSRLASHAELVADRTILNSVCTLYLEPMSGNLTLFPGGHMALQNHFRKEGVQSLLDQGYALSLSLSLSRRKTDCTAGHATHLQRYGPSAR
jgi:hypothetical protein